LPIKKFAEQFEQSSHGVPPPQPVFVRAQREEKSTEENFITTKTQRTRSSENGIGIEIGKTNIFRNI
jgi:hypothetical protein